MSFGEILLIALIGLIVIGPRRLPETVRFIALQMGRLRQTMTQTRKMVEDEFGMEDIRRQLHNEQIMRSLQSTREEIERAGKGLPPGDAKAPEATPEFDSEQPVAEHETRPAAEFADEEASGWDRPASDTDTSQDSSRTTASDRSRP